jgi:GH15 family glucan-1,4-alpha-glucosidase
MPRYIVVGNGHLTFALDGKMRIRDLFFPRVGLENHIGGHNFLIGIWANNSFSWIGDENWDFSLGYLPETLVSNVVMSNKKLNLEMQINDAVYVFSDVFLRKLVLRNLEDADRDIRIFFTHDFHLYNEDSGDTVLYEPITASVIHYKRNRYFLINGVTDNKERFFEYAVGHKESFGKEGTWKDAEDGRLSKNPVAQGSVDSVVSFNLGLKSGSDRTTYYWISCGRSLKQVEEMNSFVQKVGVEQMLLETENYWSAWVNKQALELSILPKNIGSLIKTSLLLMRTHVDSEGGIIASCDSDVLQFNRDTYSYVWPRDGAISTMAFDVFGFEEVSRLFFDFCNRAITDEGYFRHKYWSDGSTGSSWHALVDGNGNPQLPIQLDETALVLIALWKHFQKYRDLEFISKVYSRLVEKATEFMLQYRDEESGLPKPTFDMWEEKIGVFTSTSSLVCSALSCASKFAQVFFDNKRQDLLEDASRQMKRGILTHLYDHKSGRLAKAVYSDGQMDTTVDSSLLLPIIYGTLEPDNKIVSTTAQEVINSLWLKDGIGGLARYENDEFHRASQMVIGNPWPVCTLWLSRYYSRISNSLKELNRSLDILSWIAKTVLPSGLLAEQLHPFNAEPISVAPLVWSHAEFILATNDYLESYRRIKMMHNGY